MPNLTRSPNRAGALLCVLTALQSLTSSFAQAQPAEAAPAEVAPAPNPEPAPPPPPDAPPPVPVVTQSVALPAGAAEPSAVAEPPPPAAPDPRQSPMTMNAWMRLGGVAQNFGDPKKVDRYHQDGELNLLLSGQIIEMVGITANLVGSFGPYGKGGAITGDVNIMDLIAKFDFHDAFHVWGGRMLVPSDRSNFSGPWFMAPWNYPTFFKGYRAAPFGPRQGPNGRNDGFTVWGQAAGGLFKYYAGAYDLFSDGSRPLLSGRLNLALLNPEPGYYHSSTYYGKDILAIGLGAQFQKAAPGASDDYGLFNADILYEKDLGGAGVIDIEGALYKYFGDLNDYSYFALISYLFGAKLGPGALQPLVRLQQNKIKDGDTETLVDAQMGYVVNTYACRFALGYQYQHIDRGPQLAPVGHQLFFGIQLQK
jgi:hypothetical protein